MLVMKELFNCLDIEMKELNFKSSVQQGAILVPVNKLCRRILEESFNQVKSGERRTNVFLLLMQRSTKVWKVMTSYVRVHV